MWQELTKGNPYDYTVVHPGTGTEMALSECVIIHHKGYEVPILFKNYYIDDATGQWTYEILELG